MILDAGVPLKFYLSTYAEYMNSVYDNWSKLSDMVVEAIERWTPNDNDDMASWRASELSIYADVDEWLAAKCAEYEWHPDCYVPLANGKRVTLKWLFEQIVFEAGASQLWAGGQWLPYPGAVSDPMDATVVGIGMSYSDILDSIAEVGQSALVSCEFLAAAELPSVSDRLSRFSEAIADRWSKLTATAASSVSYFKGLLSSKVLQSEQVVASFYNSLGLNDVTEDENEDIILNSDIYQYTGTSPLSAIDFSSTAKAVVGVSSVAWKAIKGVWNGLVSFGKKIATDIGDKVRQTFVDPYDLYEAKSGSDLVPTVDDMAFVYTNEFTTSYLTSDPTVVDYLIRKTNGHNFTICSIFGDACINFIAESFHQSVATTTIEYQLVYRPLLLNPVVVTQLLSDNGMSVSVNASNGSVSLNGATFNGFERFCHQMRLRSDSYGSVGELDEPTALYGVVLARLLMSYYLGAGFKQFSFPDGMPSLYPESGFESTIFTSVPSSNVTNADFCRAFSGWNGTEFDSPFRTTLPSGWTHPETPGWGYLPGNAMAMLILNAIKGRYESPFDFKYVPYQKDYPAKYRGGSLAIRTDAENVDVANKIINALLLAVVVMVVVAAGSVAVRKISRGLRHKKQALQAELNAKLARGEKLTKREWRKKDRVDRKLSLMSKVQPSSDNSNPSAEEVSSVSSQQMVDASADTLVAEIATTRTAYDDDFTNVEGMIEALPGTADIDALAESLRQVIGKLNSVYSSITGANTP